MKGSFLVFLVLSLLMIGGFYSLYFNHENNQQSMKSPSSINEGFQASIKAPSSINEGSNEFESEARILGLERNLVDLQRETSQKLEEIIQKIDRLERLRLNLEERVTKPSYSQIKRMSQEQLQLISSGNIYSDSDGDNVPEGILVSPKYKSTSRMELFKDLNVEFESDLN
jgi:hypothetical protein